MSEEEIRLDQTKKVFDMLALLIKNNETCSYRYLIYDMLGFKEENYADLISGMAITNKLVDCEQQQKVLDKIKEYIKEEKEEYEKGKLFYKELGKELEQYTRGQLVAYNHIEELLEEIDE